MMACEEGKKVLTHTIPELKYAWPSSQGKDITREIEEHTLKSITRGKRRIRNSIGGLGWRIGKERG